MEVNFAGVNAAEGGVAFKFGAMGATRALFGVNFGERVKTGVNFQRLRPAEWYKGTDGMSGSTAQAGERRERPPRGWVTEYARHAGCDKGYVSRLINHRGMPFGSFEEADRWRAANCSEGVGHKSKGAAPKAAGVLNQGIVKQVDAVLKAGAGLESVEVDPALLNSLDVEAAAARARESERQAYRALQAASEQAQMALTTEGMGGSVKVGELRMMAAASLPGLLRTYTQAARARIDLEKRVLDYLQDRKTLAPVDEVWAAVREVVQPAVDGLKNMAQVVGPRANRDDPATAEAAIRDEVNALLKKLERIARRAA